MNDLNFSSPDLALTPELRNDFVAVAKEIYKVMEPYRNQSETAVKAMQQAMSTIAPPDDYFKKWQLDLEIPFAQLAKETAELFKLVDFKALMSQIDATMQQLSAAVPAAEDTVEVESTLSEFEKTLNQVSSQLPQGTADEVKATIVEPLKEKSHLPLSDSISLLGILVTVILWVLTQILPNAQLQEIVEYNGQISEQLQQSNELNEQVIEAVQVLCDKFDTLSDKLDVLTEQRQNTDDLGDSVAKDEDADSLENNADP